MANRFFRSGTIDRKTYSDQLSKTFDVMWLRAQGMVMRLERYFSQETLANGDEFRIGSVGSGLSLPVENEDTAELPQTQPATGFSKTLTMVPYRTSVKVTDNMRIMERYSKVEGMVSGLPNSGNQKREYLRAGIINGAFTGTAGADSLALCYDSHPHENNEMGTWDNLGTGALTVGNLHALRLLGQKMTDEWGRPMQVTLQDLLIPPDLERKAQELKIAEKDPETALNTPNVLIRMGYVVSPHLSSTTAYFGFGDLQGEAKGIHEVTLQAPNVKDTTKPNVDIIIFKRLKMVLAVGYSQSKNIFGSVGT